MVETAMRLVESGVVPDSLTRLGIRSLLRKRLQTERQAAGTDRGGYDAAPVAPDPARANEQHYEVPAAFFEEILGSHLKYSSCLWPDGVSSLDDAEAAMLELTCRRAGIKDGMTVLDLGCGWGSLSLWMAAQYRDIKIVSLSNSRLQGDYIRRRAAENGLDGIEVITADVNHVALERTFDRVVSIEMFEHMRNYRELLRRIAGWLTDDGRLFVHIFCHREYSYPFEIRGAGDWMAQYFFTSGMMPSQHLLKCFSDDLRVEEHWNVSGRHYARSARAWLEKLDHRRERVMAIFRDFYGEADASIWFERWRLFFMACEELFAYNGGDEWFVAHYLFRPTKEAE